MAKANGPIYAVVLISAILEEPWDVNVYTKQTSNLEVMKAYQEEIKTKHPSARVYLVTRERAHQIKAEYVSWLKKREKAKLARYDRNMNVLMTKQVYKESVKRVK